MRNADTQELEFKRWFRKVVPYWTETFEPRHGSGTGIPDVMALLPEVGGGRKLTPLEFKVGDVKIENKKIWLQQKNVRPAQVSWHYRFAEAGGKSFFLVGVKNPADKIWRVYELPSIYSWWDKPNEPFDAASLHVWKIGRDQP
jgi:hypothetical protein